ncbi:cleavage and polyadenylation specficity factor subunit-like protein [Thermococcus onnurineus NA1]|uniref:Transcription termination factor FttA n=1 Tax=Thermococcus onnurineus (strain NA1) TaxID=523850 RepID=B6YSW3_THEON|nr:MULTISPECIES: beta-CASP ribonuclease aCPSF1 [Thermococcus]ACJ15650.1 cleavage and polyadenylation specficity factor subunit-like protein [Thermococcus onnurineus NA1]NJE47009.1 beta-CASP ribonuclease aCPSF1 [Thermococcus sp. GR7]NJE78166.1 beta-CASP ribonuclease aCPSF1 [Thermococcus sp. GR4]NJF22717.1 beta-CASP ribonuclease aCPSF1 [Thermococcus sp. GR5]
MIRRETFVDDILRDIKAVISQMVPREARITDIEFEGPELVIYVKNPEAIMQDGELIKNLAKVLKKRISVRPDPEVLLPPEKAEEMIKEIVPPEAEITSISFDPSVGEVLIEAKKPGLVIGKNGETLRSITQKVHWAPKVIRTPPLQSQTIYSIRQILQTESKDRRKFLRQVGRNIYRKPELKSEWIRITGLGGFREVGRSALLVQTNESYVLVDFGVNIAALRDPKKAFPHFDAPEFRYVLDAGLLDAIIITHAHLDHSGMLPYLFRYKLFDGPIYTTPPTRDLMVLLQQDFIEIQQMNGVEPLYRPRDIKEVIKHTITLDYGEVRDIAPDMRLTLHNAGHILGSSIVHLHIGNGLHNIAITGDFKFIPTRLFEPAVSRFPRLETLVMESTYGGSNDHQMPREEAEKRLIEVIHQTIRRKGKVLIPAMAVGRAQEIMMVLEEYARVGGIEVPIYLDGMIWEATAIHTAYPEYLSRHLREQIFHEGYNPFLNPIFKPVANSRERQDIIDSGEPAIIIATSGMLVGGPSVEYFKQLAPDPKNSMIFVSYQAEGTLGRQVQRGLREIPLVGEGGKTEVVKVNMEVHTIDGFSGHADRRELISYIARLRPRPERIITVHGEPHKCLDLSTSIHKKFGISTRAPNNLDAIRLK